MKRALIILVIAVCYFPSFSQTTLASKYAKDYFRVPVELPLEIVANFGELRPDHWHMGLDIRTQQKENQLVYAAADGYIAFAGIRPQSFGRFLIINHANGLSTLYAHLNDFAPEIEQYVTDQQYKKESWAVELDIPKSLFPVRKGQFISYSGTTGGSQGPHVHFEIFETESKKRLNPLLFTFPLKDDVPPTLLKLAMYDRGKGLYDQSPLLFTLKNTDSGYIIPKVPLIKTGLRKVSFGLQAFDRISGSQNQDGIFSAKLVYDQVPQVEFVLDGIDYAETAYMNAQIDYRFRYNSAIYLQHISRLPGDAGPASRPLAGDGVVNMDDGLSHTISIDVRDAYNNISTLNFSIQYSDSLAALLPPRIAAEAIPPRQASRIVRPDFELTIPFTGLYDTIPSFYYRTGSSATYAVSSLHQVNESSIPLHGNLLVKIKPDRSIASEWRDKLVVLRSSRGTNIRRAKWEGDWVTAEFGDFGSYQVFADVIPPVINSLGTADTINLSAATRIIFTPTDNFGVRSFRAELDGKWLRFTNDKSRNWIYIFDERCPDGVHELKVTVEDMVGNASTKSWWFKKYPYTPPPKKKKATSRKSSTKKSPVKKPAAKKISRKKK